MVEIKQNTNDDRDDEDLFDGLAWLENFYGIRPPIKILKNDDWYVKDASKMKDEDWAKFFSKVGNSNY